MSQNSEIHQFDVDIAVKHGIFSAVIYDVLCKKYREGQMEFTLDDLQQHCPYLSPEEVQEGAAQLIVNGFLDSIE